MNRPKKKNKSNYKEIQAMKKKMDELFSANLVATVDYEEYQPETYKGVRIWGYDDSMFFSGNIVKDWADLMAWGAKNHKGRNVIYWSTVDDYLTDSGNKFIYDNDFNIIRREDDNKNENPHPLFIDGEYDFPVKELMNISKTF